MHEPTSPRRPSCVTPDVAPLVTELDEHIAVARRGLDDAGRQDLEALVAHAFRVAYGAEVTTFCPDLLGFSANASLRAVVGYRDGGAPDFFSEQYLDGPAERVMGRHMCCSIGRGQIAEVGNLALAHPGQARWVIAATTVFLHAAGYRWVLFTAVTHLFNAFQRLGLRPVRLAEAEPGRLPDAGASWGRYYEAGPVVCAGDISAGLGKLARSAALGQPRLHALLDSAYRLGSLARPMRTSAALVAGCAQ